MKIISWNVNGIRAVEKKGFADWLLSSGADVVCIQETKANPSQLSPALLFPGSADGTETDAVYHAYWSSAKKAGYSGTAVYTKQKPDRVELLGDALYDDEGRVVSVFFGKLCVISAYFPNSQGPGLRLDYKLGFCEAMFQYLNKLVADGYHIVLCGDYNIAHTPIPPVLQGTETVYLVELPISRPRKEHWMAYRLPVRKHSSCRKSKIKHNIERRYGKRPLSYTAGA